MPPPTASGITSTTYDPELYDKLCAWGPLLRPPTSDPHPPIIGLGGGTSVHAAVIAVLRAPDNRKEAARENLIRLMNTLAEREVPAELVMMRTAWKFSTENYETITPFALAVLHEDYETALCIAEVFTSSIREPSTLRWELLLLQPFDYKLSRQERDQLYPEIRIPEEMLNISPYELALLRSYKDQSRGLQALLGKFCQLFQNEGARTGVLSSAALTFFSRKSNQDPSNTPRGLDRELLKWLFDINQLPILSEMIPKEAAQGTPNTPLADVVQPYVHTYRMASHPKNADHVRSAELLYGLIKNQDPRGMAALAGRALQRELSALKPFHYLLFHQKNIQPSASSAAATDAPSTFIWNDNQSGLVGMLLRAAVIGGGDAILRSILSGCNRAIHTSLLGKQQGEALPPFTLAYAYMNRQPLLTLRNYERNADSGGNDHEAIGAAFVEASQRTGVVCARGNRNSFKNGNRNPDAGSPSMPPWPPATHTPRILPQKRAEIPPPRYHTFLPRGGHSAPGRPSAPGGTSAPGGSLHSPQELKEFFPGGQLFQRLPSGRLVSTTPEQSFRPDASNNPLFLLKDGHFFPVTRLFRSDASSQLNQSAQGSHPGGPGRPRGPGR